MTIHCYNTAQEFLTHAQEYLEQREAINSLPLGVCQRVARKAEQQAAETFFAVLYHGDAIAATATRIPPRHPVVVCNNDYCREEMAILARFLMDKHPDIQGVMGRVPVVQLCAEAMAQHSNQRATVSLAMHLYEANHIVPARPCPGTARLATVDDAPLLVEWTEKFLQEIFQPLDSRQHLQSIVAYEIQCGDISVWGNGGAVSMAVRNRSTRNTASIASVYTPKEYRGKGYAGANVAAFSQHLLDTGYQTCVLFTDAANPTSNAIYQRVGYKHVCDFTQYSLATP